jgi:hypothetical protein
MYQYALANLSALTVSGQNTCVGYAHHPVVTATLQEARYGRVSECFKRKLPQGDNLA